MILFAWSTWSSGCAASTPSRASTTTSFGSLMSFFMTVSSRARGAWGASDRRLAEGGLFRIREVDPRGNGALVCGRVGDEGVAQRGQGAGEELGDQVDGQLLPLHVTTRELLDQHRADRAGRVDGSP